MANSTHLREGVKRGDIFAYCKEPEKKLKAISDPWQHGPQIVITARTCEKSAKQRTCGIYALEALVPWTEKIHKNGGFT